MKESDVSVKDAAKCIGCSVGTFRNKLTQDRFSVENLIILSELCGYRLSFVPNDDTKESENLTVDEYVNDPMIQSEVNDYKEKQVMQSLNRLASYYMEKTSHDLTHGELLKDRKEYHKLRNEILKKYNLK